MSIRLVGQLAVLMLGLCLLAPAAAQAQAESEIEVLVDAGARGKLTFRRTTGGGFMRSGAEVILQDGRGRIVHRAADISGGVERLEIGGTQVYAFQTNSMGAHCCQRLHLYVLGPHRLRQAYSSDFAEGSGGLYRLVSIGTQKGPPIGV